MSERIESSAFAVERTPKIRVRNRADSTSSERGASGQVAIRVTKRAHGHWLSHATADDLARIVVNVAHNGNQILVKTDQHDSGGLISGPIWEP